MNVLHFVYRSPADGHLSGQIKHSDHSCLILDRIRTAISFG